MIDMFPDRLPRTGLGESAVHDALSSLIREHSAPLGAPTSLAHMDPPTPQIARDMVALNAAWNQNLLHPTTSPLATQIEDRLMAWLCPEFGMQWGLMCAGSTIGNLTALWAAREAGCDTVVFSEDAHISVPKSAKILGLNAIAVPVDDAGVMQDAALPDLSHAALVATAGTTGRGAIDTLSGEGARWFHVDAAWSGPLRLTRYADRLSGIETADSIAVSAHKWFYQPKDAAFILFKDPTVKPTISMGGSYLATPNVGVQGSRSANALPLFATLLAWGRDGIAERIERNIVQSEQLAAWIQSHPRLELAADPVTAIVNWRARSGETDRWVEPLDGVCSTTKIDSILWMRNVVANFNADIEAVTDRIARTISD